MLSASEFGWVKAFDRTLWYTMSQVGRKVAPAEACGVYAHWVCEEMLEKRLENPCVDLAMEGFKTEMINEGWLNGEIKKNNENEEIEGNIHATETIESEGMGRSKKEAGPRIGGASRIGGSRIRGENCKWNMEGMFRPAPEKF